MKYIDPPNDATQRKLVLLSKVLQNLANGIHFGVKEEYMRNLNDFITENLPILHKFFDEISVNYLIFFLFYDIDNNLQVISSESEQPKCMIPEIPKFNGLLYLQLFIIHNQSKIITDLKNNGKSQIAQVINKYLMII